MINHQNIKIPSNYLLVKVDEDFKKYHVNGKESSIYIGTTNMEELDKESFAGDEQETVLTADHWADTGVVVKSPIRYTYNGDKINSIIKRKGLSIDEYDLKEISSLKDHSLVYVTEDEFNEGDRLKFNYACRMQNEVIETDIGQLMLIHRKDIDAKFDSAGMMIPVNGNVFFELVQQKTTILDLDLTVTRRIWELEGIQKGILHSLGKPIQKALEDENFVDETDELQAGSTIYFESFHAYNIESEGHFFVFGGKEIFCINRYNILATE